MQLINDFEAFELAAAMLGQDEPETAEQEEALEEALLERFGVDIEVLIKVAGALLPLCAEGRSPLTDRAYRGFAKDGCFIVKTEA